MVSLSHATAAALLLPPAAISFSPLVNVVIIFRAAAGWSIGTMCPAPVWIGFVLFREREGSVRAERGGRETKEEKKGFLENEKKTLTEHANETKSLAVALDLPRGGSLIVPVVEAPVLEVGVLKVVAARPGQREHPAQVAELVAVFVGVEFLESFEVRVCFVFFRFWFRFFRIK